MAAAELFDLTGKVAVITGGAGGIGVVYAQALCEAGASVVVADLDAAAAEGVAGGFMPGGIYGVSKYALHGLTVNLAAELGGRNINVNAIAPGLVDNESGYAALPKDSPFRDALAAAIPGKTSGPPEDLVGVLL